jgi:hypothetical protein
MSHKTMISVVWIFTAATLAALAQGNWPALPYRVVADWPLLPAGWTFEDSWRGC